MNTVFLILQHSLKYQCINYEYQNRFRQKNCSLFWIFKAPPNPAPLFGSPDIIRSSFGVPEICEVLQFKESLGAISEARACNQTIYEVKI